MREFYTFLSVVSASLLSARSNRRDQAAKTRTYWMSILSPIITEPLQAENFTIPGADAFLAFDCRPLFRWIACGTNYSYNLKIFYAAFCCLHAISTFGALLYTLWTFCSCCGRTFSGIYMYVSLVGQNPTQVLETPPDFVGSDSSVTLKVLFFRTSISCALYCFFLTDGRGYGVPTWVLGFLWGNTVNCLGSAAGLLVLSWASALDDRTFAITSFLGRYKIHFYVVLADRSLSTLLMILSSIDIGGSSYSPLLRLFCAHWAAYGAGLALSMLYYGRKMISRLNLAGIPMASSRNTRVMVLYIGTASSVCVFACVQTAVQPIMEINGTLWLVILGLYHAVVAVLATWFIIGRPSDNELQRDTSKTARSDYSRSAASEMIQKYSLEDSA